MQLHLQLIYAYLPSAQVEQTVLNMTYKENFARISQRSPKSNWIYGLKITSSPTNMGPKHSIKFLQPKISMELQMCKRMTMKMY